MGPERFLARLDRNTDKYGAGKLMLPADVLATESMITVERVMRTERTLMNIN
jgi:hypothetical protein